MPRFKDSEPIRRLGTTAQEALRRSKDASHALINAASTTIDKGKGKAKKAAQIGGITLAVAVPSTPLIILPIADGAGWIDSDDEKPPSDITGAEKTDEHTVFVDNGNDMYDFTVEEVAADGVVADGRFVIRPAWNPNSTVVHHPDQTIDYGIGVFDNACPVEDFTYSGVGDAIQLNVVSHQPDCLTVLVDFINNPSPIKGANTDTSGAAPIGQ